MENTGSVRDTFNLTYTNPDNASVALNQTQVQLNASVAVNVSLNVTNATVGTFRVNVTTTSQSDKNKTAAVNTTTTVISYGVNLTVDQKANTTVVGENATYTLTLENTGSVADTYNLTVTNQDNASVTGLSKTQVPLNASETETVALKVGDVVAGTFRVNVTATSQKGTNETAVVSTTTTVISYGVNITVDQKAKTVVTGENATYTLTVENTGSVADTFNLTVTNQDNVSVIGLNMTQVQLNASDAETVALKVGDVAVGTFRVNVTATSQSDISKTACVNTTTTVASLTVTPPSVNVGDFVTIEGAGFGANETLTLSCHVSDLEVPVSGNKYEYTLKEFNLSDPNTGFSLSVREVKDDTEVHIKKQGLPVVKINKSSPSKLGFEFDYNATTHTSTVSVPMPIDPRYTGIYELIEVSGTVVGNTTEVFMDLTVDNSVTTDATGYFKTVIDTHGFPPQEYTITADGVAATLTVCHLIVPDHAVMEGELVTIEGEGFGANETLILSSQSNFTINVSGSEYEYTLKEFNLSDPNTGFSLSVREVKDDTEVHIKKQGLPVVKINKSSPSKLGFEFDYNATTHTSTVSVPMPIDPSYTGIYEFIEVSGTAFSGTSNVYMDIMVINSVTTTESGYFETVIDTHGFPPHEYTITATSVTASAKATLTIIPATGAITVTSSPTGAAIELDGNSTKLKTNATISDVSPGTHSIKLTLDGYQGWSENVPVQAGETYYVNATLTPNPTPAPRGGGGGGSGGGPADTDGDGYCNIDETIMGTDPEDPCDPDPNCVACQALVGTHILPPVVEQTPRPTSTIKYLTTPTPRPKPTPATTPTPTPKPLLPILGPDKPIILIVIIVAVSVLIAALYFLHRKFKSVDTENHDSDRIVWR